MTAFADTSALYALLDRDDANHPRAAAVFDDLVDAEPLVTSAPPRDRELEAAKARARTAARFG